MVTIGAGMPGQAVRPANPILIKCFPEITMPLVSRFYRMDTVRMEGLTAGLDVLTRQFPGTFMAGYYVETTAIFSLRTNLEFPPGITRADLPAKVKVVFHSPDGEVDSVQPGLWKKLLEAIQSSVAS